MAKGSSNSSEKTQVRWGIPDEIHQKISAHQKLLNIGKKKQDELSLEDAAIHLLEKATSHLQPQD